MPRSQIVAGSAAAAASNGRALPADEHEQELYRTQSRHGNPYLVTDKRVCGMIGAAREPGSVAVQDIGELAVRKGLLHSDYYWTVRFDDAVLGPTANHLMFFKSKSMAEEMVRQIQQARAIASGSLASGTPAGAGESATTPGTTGDDNGSDVDAWPADSAEGGGARRTWPGATVLTLGRAQAERSRR